MNSDLGVMLKSVVEEAIYPVKISLNELKDNVAYLQEEQHAMRNDIATLQKDQHAMRKDLTTLQKDQHAMRNDLATLQKDQHTIKDEQQKMNTRLKKVEVLLNLTYEQTGHLTEKYQEISSKLENVATRDDLVYFDKKLGKHDRQFHKLEQKFDEPTV